MLPYAGYTGERVNELVCHCMANVGIYPSHHPNVFSLKDAKTLVYWSPVDMYTCMYVHAYLRKIMPILEMVAGEAHDRSCDSNRKLMLGPNWILSPEGIVSSL